MDSTTCIGYSPSTFSSHLFFFIVFLETLSKALPIFHTNFMVWTSDIFLPGISDHLLLMIAIFYHFRMSSLRLYVVLLGLLSQCCASLDSSTCVPRGLLINNPLSQTPGQLVLPQMLHIYSRRERVFVLFFKFF